MNKVRFEMVRWGTMSHPGAFAQVLDLFTASSMVPSADNPHL